MCQDKFDDPTIQFIDDEWIANHSSAFSVPASLAKRLHRGRSGKAQEQAPDQPKTEHQRGLDPSKS